MAAPVTLAARLDALTAALDTSDGRLNQALTDEARAVVARATERGGLSPDCTVVALAGSTGSGKSSLINALTGATIATPGVTRPTTSHAVAAVWGEGADPLLDWLDIPSRHHITTTPEPLDAAKPKRRKGTDNGDPSGLILLDLPDHDSVVIEHRYRAERLVARADLLVWVVDPQKYADAALHERYLRPLAGREGVTVIVLNQVDRLSVKDGEAMRADLARLVAADGLTSARVVSTSTRSGQGIDELRSLLTAAAQKREAATARLTADVRDVAARIVASTGSQPNPKALDKAKTSLVDAFQNAAGVSTVVEAMRRSALYDARATTGWPVTRWLGSLRPDPLHRIGLKKVPAEPGRDDLIRSSLPPTNAGVQAAAATAVRGYVDEATRGAPDAWVLSARQHVAESTDRLSDALDQAIVGTTIAATKRPLWYRVVNLLQWLLFAVLVAGLLWLGVAFAMSYFQLPPLPMPVLTVGGEHGLLGGRGVLGDGVDLPWATVLVALGVVLALLVSAVSRIFAGVGATRRAAIVRKRLRAAVTNVADIVVRKPLAEELSALDRTRQAAALAASGA
ncbi:MAG: 50S ribosome-binding GTPase [Cellulomonadaceae bacterium]|jgi:GTP-binding protein EngB required for normal cell division|nr:50S ribosome-binding GTPase [Cellulomonadaceae bacterium]